MVAGLSRSSMICTLILLYLVRAIAAATPAMPPPMMMALEIGMFGRVEEYLDWNCV
jgi:hypothetical protein